MLATLHRCALAASFSQKGAALTARLRVNRQAARSAARSLAPALAQARSFMLLPRRGGGGGDPTLTRNKYRSVIKEQLPLTLGGSLPEVRIDWEQWGDPSLPGERTVLVLPPFSHSSHAASNRDDPRPGWWENLIGPGKAIDTSYFRVICPAALGSPFSGTSPLSIDPRTGEPYRSSFPQITIADMAACHAKVLDDVGIDRVHAVVGGSMGGMQALEFAAQFPKRLERLIGITCTHQSTPGSVAFRRVQRHAILSDPAYNDGNYPSGAVLNGMKIARELGLTCYRSREDLDQSFDWNPTGAENFNSATFDVENYMSYEAEKFARSFDPNCYLLLSKALDLMNLGRGYTNLATGTKRITCPSLIIGIKQDLLVPVEEQRNLVAILQSYGRRANLVELSSKYGHDAMFVEDAQLELLAPIVHKYIEYPIADLLPVEQHRYSSL